MLEYEAGKPVFANDPDKARSFQFLHMMRKSCSTDGMSLKELTTGQGRSRAADLLKHLESSRFSQRSRDQLKLLIGQSIWLGAG